MSNFTQDALSKPERVQALVNAGLLDTPVEETFDRLTRLAKQILKAPVSLISLVEPDRQFFKSQVGLSEPWATIRETPLSHSFCQHVVTSGEPLVIEDARKHPLVCDNLAIRDLNVVSYLGIPLTSVDGWHLGSLCVIDSQPRIWSQDEIETMQTLADTVMTEMKLRLESKAKEEALADLAARNEQLDAFAHTVSHNLKNPISAIIGWASLGTHYSERITFEELMESVKQIEDVANYANDIVDALLLLATVSRNQVKSQRLNMFNIIDDALARFQLQIRDTGATVNLPDADTFPRSMGYKQWVEEIWMNYISNAIKYGGRPPLIEFGADKANTGYVRYWIKDNGTGISQEQQAALFIPFSRLQHTAQVQGHGLGLSIVRTIVEKLGGEVGVESEVGAGSIFSFTLPIV